MELTSEECDEMEARATELRCSYQVALYIIALEKRVDRLEDKLDTLWEDYQQR